jgi:aminoglycoside phosphotransferase (APT) family kinase protein
VIQGRRRLAEACALVPRVLADASPSLPRAARGSIVGRAWLTSTDMAVVMLVGGADGRPSAVIKLPLTGASARGLGRESAALAALHADARLAEWRARLARPLAAGIVSAQPYRIDAILPGRPVVVADVEPALEERAVEVIGVLHRATAASVAGDPVRWIDEPLRHLERHGPPRAAVASVTRRLRAELHAAVAGRTFRAGWIHGDYWLGNLLFAETGDGPQGIVDWEAAGVPELPLHDVLHLLLTTRRLRDGCELAAIVVDHLSGTPWPPRERRLLDRHAAPPSEGALSDRHALLLYWLRQVGMHARQQSRLGGYRYRLWERRNVHAVLTAL